MSLVEQALKKMQLARREADSAAAVAVFSPSGKAPPADPPAPRPAPPPVQRSTRVIKIDRVALQAAGVLPPESDERALAQDFRQIKRPLIAAVSGRGGTALPNGHLIMLASALPGDGKTFTSVNLALSMALESGINVLLVDADVAKPHISTIFGVAQEPGLLDVLRDEKMDVESVVMSTDVEGLSVLPAGRMSDTATELLASARMEAIAAQLGARDPNRIVLFDSPPLLLTTESRALSAIVGQIVMVVGAGVTPQKAVFEALEFLGEGKNISLVLNQSDEQTRTGYYNYYGQQAAS